MFFLKDLPSRNMIASYSDIIPTGGEDDIADALQMMRRASLLVRKIDQYFADNDLSQLRFLIMIVIDREPDRSWLYQTEIAQKLDVSKPVLTRTVQSLIKVGLLSMADDADDRRAKRLYLTAFGQERLTDLLPSYFALITEFMRSGQ